MMIQRYALGGTFTGMQTVYMPKDAKIVNTEIIQGTPYMWAYVNENNMTEPRCFYMAPDSMSFAGYESRVKNYLGKLNLDTWTYYHLLELTQ
jgi:hypothetical protein